MPDRGRTPRTNENKKQKVEEVWILEFHFDRFSLLVIDFQVLLLSTDSHLDLFLVSDQYVPPFSARFKFGQVVSKIKQFSTPEFFVSFDVPGSNSHLK